MALGDADGAQVVVEDGLKEGERVIEGFQKVRPGMAVAVSEAPPGNAERPEREG